MKGEYIKEKKSINVSSGFKKFNLLKNYYSLFFVLTIFALGCLKLIPEKWVTVKINQLEFEYPGNFSLLETRNDSNIYYELYEKDKLGKTAIFYSINLYDKNLDPELIFNNLIQAHIQQFSGRNIEVTDVKINENSIALKTHYKINSLSLNGYGFMYVNDNKINILLLVPYEGDYTEKTFNRIISSIKINLTE